MAVFYNTNRILGYGIIKHITIIFSLIESTIIIDNSLLEHGQEKCLRFTFNNEAG